MIEARRTPMVARHSGQQRRRSLLWRGGEFRPEHWDEAIAVNLSAPFHTIRLTLRR